LQLWTSRYDVRRVLSKRCKTTEAKIDEARERMRFWDASAVIPLLVDEPARERLLDILEQDAEMLAWWATPIEIASALARRERESVLSADEVTTALAMARVIAEAWHEIMPSDSVRRTAERLLRVHPLHAADSLQLSAALIAADHDPISLEFVCLDTRLASAARREGFSVLGL
jgi:predicted nucleic acid-binding protein